MIVASTLWMQDQTSNETSEMSKIPLQQSYYQSCTCPTHPAVVSADEGGAPRLY